MQERNIRDQNRPQRLPRRRTDTTKHSRAKERIVRRRFSTPYTRSSSDQHGDNSDRPPAKPPRKRNPNEVRKTEHENGDADEVDNLGESRVEIFHVVRDLGGQGQRAEGVVESRQSH